VLDCANPKDGRRAAAARLARTLGVVDIPGDRKKKGGGGEQGRKKNAPGDSAAGCTVIYLVVRGKGKGGVGGVSMHAPFCH
jgi:hypothetical protein